jgi:hypothetical protein
MHRDKRSKYVCTRTPAYLGDNGAWIGFRRMFRERASLRSRLPITYLGDWWIEGNRKGRNRGGPAEIRTLDPQLARLMLYQLSYRPTMYLTRSIVWRLEANVHPFNPNYLRFLVELVGLGRLELPTSRLSGVYSNQLSYRPVSAARLGK